MAIERPPQPKQRWEHWKSALSLIIPALAAGILILIWHMSTKGDRWISPNQPETTGFDPALPMVFFAALLITQLIERKRREAIPEPLLLAAVVTIAVWLSADVFFSLGMVFMYAGVKAMIAIVSILVFLVLSACAWITRHIPIRRSSWADAAAKITLSLVVLLWMLPPWQTIRISAISPEEKHAAALAEFGMHYTLAVDVIRKCAAIRDVTGNLNALTISHRRNLVESNPYWDDTYFDFDYIGTQSNGRITINIQHLKAISSGNQDGNEPRSESLVGREGTSETLAFIYPNYSESWVNRPCRLPALKAGNSESGA